MARILIVEDEVLIALVASDTLVDAGHSVVGMATTFEGGLQAAEEHLPDLALLDVRIASKADGIDLALELRTKFDIPAIFTTGSRDEITVSRAEPARPAGWLLKPYSEDDLVAVVQAALAGQGQAGSGQTEGPDQAVAVP